jgi:hypothetical protein
MQQGNRISELYSNFLFFILLFFKHSSVNVLSDTYAGRGLCHELLLVRDLKGKDN